MLEYQSEGDAPALSGRTSTGSQSCSVIGHPDYLSDGRQAATCREATRSFTSHCLLSMKREVKLPPRQPLVWPGHAHKAAHATGERQARWFRNGARAPGVVKTHLDQIGLLTGRISVRAVNDRRGMNDCNPGRGMVVRFGDEVRLITNL